MTISTEQLGRELARQIYMLAAMKDEKKEAMQAFKLREQTIVKEINRLAMDVQTGQSSLYPRPESR
ncbi:MAG: hypothetical protein HOP00_03945 [Nitrospira sp.]|nr:hypothetical protein [Nitrospira sp.]